MSRPVILTEAINVIEKIGWTQSVFARDENGRPCGMYSEEAACFCIAGAIYKASCGQNFLAASIIDGLSMKLPKHLALSHWNDEPDRTKEEVVEFLRKERDAMLAPTHAPVTTEEVDQKGGEDEI